MAQTLCSHAGARGSIPSQGTRSHATTRTRHSQINKYVKVENKNKARLTGENKFLKMKIKGSFAEVLGTAGLWGRHHRPLGLAGTCCRAASVRGACTASQVSTHRMPPPVSPHCDSHRHLQHFPVFPSKHRHPD